MARATITAQEATGNTDYDGAALTFTACDATNKNQVAMLGGEVFIFRNDDASPQTVTITSVADDLGRTKDCTKSVTNGTYWTCGPFKSEGWIQSDGYIYFEAATATVMVAVVRVRPTMF